MAAIRHHLSFLARRFALCLPVVFPPAGLCAAEALQPFPVTVSHKLGTASIAAEPTRIVALGWSGEDAVLAFGQIPVAMPAYPRFEAGVFPWNVPYLAGAEPVLMSGLTDFERIAALKPDLILAIRSGVKDKDYARLSSIAPTVVYRSGPWIAGWRELTRLTGAALGQPEAAETQIAGVEAALAAMRAEHPALQGKSFIFGTYFAGQNSVVVYLPDDPRVQILATLGLTIPQAVRDLAAAAPGKASVGVSLERADSLDSDLLLMWYREGAKAAAAAQPMFKLIPAVRQGGHVALTSAADVWGTSALSVLSIPYVFPDVLDRLAQAAETVAAAQRAEAAQ